MKIGIISDLHGIFPKIFEDFIKDSDEIWCLGDIFQKYDYDMVAQMGIPIQAIKGNWEIEYGTDLNDTLKSTLTFNREGLNIHLAHKGYYPPSYGDKYQLGQIDRLKKKDIDLFCYGHIHSFEYHTLKFKDHKNIYCLNPGAISPLYNETASAVTIEIENGKIKNCKVKKVQTGFMGYKGKGYNIIVDKERIDPLLPFLYKTQRDESDKTEEQ